MLNDFYRRKEDIWFDDVDQFLIEGLEVEPEETTDKSAAENPLVKSYSFEGLVLIITVRFLSNGFCVPCN